jgi:hypothetical protein
MTMTSNFIFLKGIDALDNEHAKFHFRIYELVFYFIARPVTYKNLRLFVAIIIVWIFDNHM